MLYVLFDKTNSAHTRTPEKEHAAASLSWATVCQDVPTPRMACHVTQNYTICYLIRRESIQKIGCDCQHVPNH